MPKLGSRSLGVQQNKTIHAKPGIQTDPAEILSHLRQKATLALKLGNNIDARK
ncbi:hypothetical protein [Laspinema olomoucense]|uniref:hypothetical protein n=1 Tax=Laspinema olomoucense TaxID=3231600 RepID=UPI0021BA7F14|nr:hypothetical protein [Laspinema sp. D3c]MCT7993630.1 hypothetical protein [Laspinema sp. D3c]